MFQIEAAGLSRFKPQYKLIALPLVSVKVILMYFWLARKFFDVACLRAQLQTFAFSRYGEVPKWLLVNDSCQ